MRLHFASLVSSFAFTALISACSSSDNTTPGVTQDSAVGADTSTTTDTGTTPEDTSTTPTDTSTTPDDTGSGKTDGGTMCGSDPMLHPPKTGDGVYCPGEGDGGMGANCAVGQICCDTPKGSTPASSCIAGGSTCPTTSPKAGSSWECDSPTQCGGKVCCGTGTPKLRTGCTYEEVFPSTSTTCAASCPSGSFIVCEAPGDCPSGKTCTAIKSGGKQIGYCK